MKRILSSVLVIALALTTVVSALPTQSTASAKLDDYQMLSTIGGTTLACAGTLLAVGTGLIIAGASGPVGWGLFALHIVNAAGWITAGCGG